MTVAAAGRQVRRRSRAGPALTALWLAGWALAVGVAVVVAPVLLIWSVGGHATDGPGGALRLGVLTWLAGQHAAAHTAGGTFGVTPLGVTVLLAAVLRRAGRVLALRADTRDLRAAAVALGPFVAAYAVAAAVLARAVPGRLAVVSPAHAAIGAGLLAVLAVGSGLASQAGLWPAATGFWPPEVSRAVRTGLLGAAGLGGVAAAAAGLALLVGAGRFATASSALHAGPGGGLGLLLGQLALLPNLLIAVAAFSVGATVHVGAATVSVLHGAPGALPPLPLLVLVPGHASATAGLAVAAAGGTAAVVGWRSAGRTVDAGWRRALAEPVAAVAVTAVLLAIAGWLAGGPVEGFGRVGPSLPGSVGGALLVLVPSALSAVAARRWQRAGGVNRLRAGLPARRSAA
jgi:uncharacterized membrane protein YidH (DUF202 family)